MIAAVYIVHYGAQWLGWSVRSVQRFVDGVLIYYTSSPSHGHNTALKCPETQTDVLTSAWWFADGTKFRFYEVGPFFWEGQHRDYAVSDAASMGYDRVLVVDADEIWAPDLLERFIVTSVKSSARSIRVGMRHFWRSTKWVCDDDAAPLRFINTRNAEGEAYYPLDGGRVYHMGYAQTPEIIRYKIDIHGHKNEFRPGWYAEKFLAWKPGMEDVHPTNVNYWTPNPYQDSGELQGLIGDHPFWGRELIE